MRDSAVTSEALIAIGSNITPETNIPKALRYLSDAVQVRRVSTFYWSEPIGLQNQARFLNGACLIATELGPRELKFDVLRLIESDLGRTRSADKYAPREIDLDIALFGNISMSEPGLTIPDPEIEVRPFLAVPLAEIAPDWQVSSLGRTLGEIAGAMSLDNLSIADQVTKELKKEFPG